MAKTEMTKNIEQAIIKWHPAQIGDIKINKFRGEHTALEVVAECGTTAGGIIDAVRVSEYFGEDDAQKVLLSCFEIKVTKADFKSKHGHNFIGNMNYYVVPEEIYKEVEPLAPEYIGIIAYLHREKYCGLRTKRKPTFRDMSEAEQKWLILSVFKRVRSMDYALYKEKMLKMQRKLGLW